MNRPQGARIFSIGYPNAWITDTNELKKPGYFDTTIRDPSNPEHTYLRIDYSLNVRTSLYDAANQQRQFQPPGYRELGFDNTTLGGRPAIRWEFEGYQKGSDGQSVFVHKIDIFMIDSSHTGWAILTQAPASNYYSWLPTFTSIFATFTDTQATTTPPPSASSPVGPSGKLYAVLTDLPIRAGTNTSASRLGTLPAGAMVGVQCKQRGEIIVGPWGHDPYWDQVTFDGITGFVTDEWIDTKSDEANPAKVPLC